MKYIFEVYKDGVSGIIEVVAKDDQEAIHIVKQLGLNFKSMREPITSYSILYAMKNYGWRQMINANKIVELLNRYENVFTNLYVTWDDSYLDSIIKTDIQVEELINRCSQDMINVDKITKERWLQI